MRPSSLGYLLKQGWKNMAANRLMSFASIGVLTACLIITGIASLLSININRVVDYFGQQNEIKVYLDENLGAEEIDAIAARIGAIENVASYELIDKDEAYAQMLEWMEDYRDLLTGLEHVFPRNFRVTVSDLTLMEQTNTQIKQLQGVESTVAPSEVAGVMVKIKNAVTYGGWGLVAVLALVSIVVISNTIRLTVFARRREITIMKYVGATNAFIRMPFFVEGMTVGIIAGLLASGVVCLAYNFAYNWIAGTYDLWVASLITSLVPLSEAWPVILVGFLAFGAVVGSIGTTTSIRKHLQV